MPDAITTNAHQSSPPQIYPKARHYNGVTYSVWAEISSLGTPDGADITVGAYDHSAGTFQRTIIDTVPSDNHHFPAIEVDDSGFVYVAYDFRNSGGDFGQGSNIVAKSESAEDISSFSTIHNVSGERDYAQLSFVAATGTLCLLNRGEMGSTRPVFLSWTSDGGSTWSSTELYSLSGNWNYPQNNAVDGSDVYYLTYGRDQSESGFAERDGVYVVRFDTSDDTLYGLDGTALSTPATRSDLQNAGSEVSATGHGGTVAIDPNGVVYATYIDDTASGEGFMVGRYDGGWSESVLESDLPGDNYISAANFSLDVVDASTINIFETEFALEEASTAIGQYQSSDGGSSWSSRSDAEDLSDIYPNGASRAFPVRGFSSPVKYTVHELADPSSFAALGEMRMMDSTFTTTSYSTASSDPALSARAGGSVGAVSNVSVRDGGALTDAQSVKVRDGGALTTVWEASTSSPSASEADAKLAHRWRLDDVNGTITDSVGSADGTNNGVTSAPGDWIGGSAGDGGSGDNYIETTTLGGYGSNMADDFAVAFTIQTTDVGFLTQPFGASNGGSASQLSTDLTDTGALRINIRDAGDNRITVDTDNAYNDGNPHRVVINKTANDGSGIDFWVDQTDVAETIDTNQDFSNPADFSYPFVLFAYNKFGSVQNYLDAIVDDVCLYTDSLTDSEIQSYSNPW